MEREDSAVFNGRKDLSLRHCKRLVSTKRNGIDLMARQMKQNQESFIAPLALLAAAAAVAYLAPDPHRSRQEPVDAHSEDDATPQQALAPGRGRHATAPTHIPLKGWKDIIW